MNYISVNQFLDKMTMNKAVNEMPMKASAIYNNLTKSPESKRKSTLVPKVKKAPALIISPSENPNLIIKKIEKITKEKTILIRTRNGLTP